MTITDTPADGTRRILDAARGADPHHSLGVLAACVALGLTADDAIRILTNPPTAIDLDRLEREGEWT